MRCVAGPDPEGPRHSQSLAPFGIPADLCSGSEFFRKTSATLGIYLFSMARDSSTQQCGEPATGQPSQGGRVDWPAVLALHARWLRTVVLARVGNATSADDVLQEVAMAAVEKGHQLRDPASAAPWLYRLAVMSALQYRRKQGRRRNLLDRFTERTQPTDCDAREVDPLDWLVADERRQLVRQALEHLPARDAEVLLLKYTEDWSYRQLFDHLGLSESAVEARLHRARQKMRRALAKVDSSFVVDR